MKNEISNPSPTLLPAPLSTSGVQIPESFTLGSDLLRQMFSQTLTRSCSCEIHFLAS